MSEMITVDGNEAAARIAYKVNEVIAIYPITPSSPMGEEADQWAADGKKNIWGSVPLVVEMQSEAGASGAVHGALQRGALTTTFTASQGLLLMIPNMYKIAGELNSAVFHVAARTIATHALSIFCDHSDVMAARSTGFAILSSASVQEAHDFALISQVASLRSRVPFVHFFDGFRTSHELSKIESLSDETIRILIDNSSIQKMRSRALSPDHPFIRGTSQNPDIFFQAREASNTFYNSCPGIVKEAMDCFAKLTGRVYDLFEYYGSDDAERVIVLMGSGINAVEETINYLRSQGEKVGCIGVRLFRPFSVPDFVRVLPQTVKRIAVLDRTKEPGSTGEPLYNDVVSALFQEYQFKTTQAKPLVEITGGRYGLSSKEFTPSMIRAVFDELSKPSPKEHFTVGITDDLTMTSLPYNSDLVIEHPDQFQAVFYGSGADGTVSANKNSIKIIGKETTLFVQGYFIYDSMKSGSVTVSHLRFDKKPIKSTYRVIESDFIAVHQFGFLERVNVLETVKNGTILLLNSSYSVNDIWDNIPRSVQETIIMKKMRVHVIDAYSIAKECGLGGRINTVMQTCFFMLTSLIPGEYAVEKIKDAVKKSYGKRGEVIVNNNLKAIERAQSNLHELCVPSQATSHIDKRTPVPPDVPEFVKTRTAKMIAGKGDELPVSAFEPDGTFPSGTIKYMKRNITLTTPVWDPDVCIQCGRCSVMCPHAVIRAKLFETQHLQEAPQTFKFTESLNPLHKGLKFSIAVSPEDCTGCGVCQEVCPAKNKNNPKFKAVTMIHNPNERDDDIKNWNYFLSIPDYDRISLNESVIRDVQFLTPLFEFSGACAGCGETPYLTLLSRLFGDRAIIANATGCSSIYGGNEPATPWTVNQDGRGPAWSNSLFEDNAEFGLGFRLAIDKQVEYAHELLRSMSAELGKTIVDSIINAKQDNEQDLLEQRKRVSVLRDTLSNMDIQDASSLNALLDVLVKKSIWCIGGDGWAYDIGFGGLDHVLSLGKKINILVLDTEVYSNTGGQMSKATPAGAVAKFAARGKRTSKKDLAMMAMTYGSVYVARVAMGADVNQAIKAFNEAENFNGTSLILAYSQCIGHGYDLSQGMLQQKKAVQSGHWPLLRYNPDLLSQGKNPLQIDSAAPSLSLDKYIYNETRYAMLKYSYPQDAEKLYMKAVDDVNRRWKWYEHLSQMYAERKNV
ncbi:MAG TPA: pyruvate:ferredoxin (flavodoxin) oxidoreductase [Chitinispirillaceae bacterium]|nr:pyruvate:ferredoxin (flavodoxin) oxidoreductase [Chitinispirillaceae bacterium]